MAMRRLLFDVASFTAMGDWSLVACDSSACFVPWRSGQAHGVRFRHGFDEDFFCCALV